MYILKVGFRVVENLSSIEDAQDAYAELLKTSDLPAEEFPEGVIINVDSEELLLIDTNCTVFFNDGTYLEY